MLSHTHSSTEQNQVGGVAPQVEGADTLLDVAQSFRAVPSYVDSQIQALAFETIEQTAIALRELGYSVDTEEGC